MNGFNLPHRQPFNNLLKDFKGHQRWIGPLLPSTSYVNTASFPREPQGKGMLLHSVHEPQQQAKGVAQTAQLDGSWLTWVYTLTDNCR